MSASLLSCFAKSIMASAEFCWSQGPAAAKRVEKAVTEMGLHFSPPPAAVYNGEAETCSVRRCEEREDGYSRRLSPIAGWRQRWFGRYVCTMVQPIRQREKMRVKQKERSS